MAPELSYWKPEWPQVCGSADAGTAVATASKRASAIVILVIMIHQPWFVYALDQN